MATAFKMSYTTGGSVTITLASLASSATAGRESTVVDNSTNLDLDAHLYCRFVPQSGTPANDKGVYVYGYGLADATPNYPDNLTGADAACTPTSEANLTLLSFVNIAASATAGGRWIGSIAMLLGGMPIKWGIFVRNYCGFALSATEGNHIHTYNRVQTQGV